MINIEHTNAPNQHFQQHFQNHYSATSESNLSDMNNPRFPTVGYDTHSSRRQTPLLGNESSHSQIVQSQYDQHGNLKCVEQKEEQHAKKTTQTTTTTTTHQPYIIQADTVPFIDSADPFMTHTTTLNEGGTGTMGVRGGSNLEADAYKIKVEHHPIKVDSFNWSNLDVYLHIFLTFYFGHFAAMLFFDGILRNIFNLYLMEHTAGSIIIYILHIVFSIAFLAFTVWFMTICWRWWRHKSLIPSTGFDYAQRSIRPRSRHSTAHGYIFLSACILIVGFFFFLALGCIDLGYKRRQTLHGETHKQYEESLYMADLIVFVFRLIFWLVGIVATLMLSREVLYKYCCPAKRIKINKERPTTVYEVTN